MINTRRWLTAALLAASFWLAGCSPTNEPADQASAVAGLWEAHQRYGSLPWKDLVMPAVALAEDGFLPAKALVDDIHSTKEWFGDSTDFWDHFGSISTEQPFRQPELGRTLRRIAELGPEDFYRGETARMIVEQMEKRVFADHAEYLGDPDYVDNPIERLIADDYIAQRAREVNPDEISQLDAVQPGLESPDTTHYFNPAD